MKYQLQPLMNEGKLVVLPCDAVYYAVYGGSNF